jgi:3-oxoadipate enol-lactonase
MPFAFINKHTIHYKYLQQTALQQQPVFVFINSLGTDFRIWKKVAAQLQPYGNILLFDKRGHGLSDVVEDTQGLSDFTDDVIALLQYLHIEKIIPIGLSVGGMIAQLLATRMPAQVTKLVLCDTRHKIGHAQIWNDRIKGIQTNGLPSIADGVMQRWFPESFHKEQPVKVAGYKNMLQRTDAVGYIKTCEAIRDADLTEQAKQISMPALCVVGSEDKSTLPEEVKNLADLITHSRFEIIEGSGHIPCVDNPVALSKLIIDFIN